jgi:ribosomal protein S6--L-glutamate ligase
VKIAFLVSSARASLPLLGPIPEEIFPLLAKMTHSVEVIFGEDRAIDLSKLTPQHDLYVLKGHDEFSLSLAGALSSQGAPVLNSYQASADAENKIICMTKLGAAGVRVPKTWLASHGEQLLELLAGRDLIVKPLFGGMGRSSLIKRVSDIKEAESVDLSGGICVTQEFIFGPEHDLKVYVAGSACFAVRKRFAPMNFNNPGSPARVSAAIAALAARVGEVLDLGLFGIDVIESESGPVVVDVNYFPSYFGIKAAPVAIAEYIDQCARGAVSLKGGGCRA